MTIIVIYGPSGSGKTANAKMLMQKYNCKRVIDEWALGDIRQLKDDDLVLAQESCGWGPDCKVISIKDALA